MLHSRKGLLSLASTYPRPYLATARVLAAVPHHFLCEMPRSVDLDVCCRLVVLAVAGGAVYAGVWPELRSLYKFGQGPLKF